MKCNVRHEVCITPKSEKNAIRGYYSCQADSVLVEKFCFGKKRISLFHERLIKTVNHYDCLYNGERRVLLDDLCARCEPFFGNYKPSRGNSKRFAQINEMEIIVMEILITLHDTFGFGKVRLRRFFDAINNSSSYYNTTFKGTDINVIEVMQGREKRYIGDSWIKWEEV